MNPTIDDNDRVWCMADAVCEGAISEGELQELEDRLLGDENARCLYIAYCQLDAALNLELGGRRSGTLTCEIICKDISAAIASDLPNARMPSMSSSPLPPSILSNTLYRSNDYYADWPVAYLVATAIFAIGFLIGSHIYVSHPVQVAEQSPSITKSQSAPVPQMDFVGRITGMVDCQWADPQTEAFNGANVPLGRKYALSSGLMEITYDTGAKVILQGPVTYEVESKYGGFLPVGKLTGKVISENAKGFAVRTPTATVTDLGTEFGVEVDKAGVTETYVFVGKVRLEGQGHTGVVPIRILTAGQGARLDTRAILVDVSADSHDRFLRKMPAPKTAASNELIDRIDYSDTWTANTRNRPGSYLLLPGAALRVEQCPGNPSREWVFSGTSAMTTWPTDDPPTPWPGFQVSGTRSGFMECGGSCCFGLVYGLRNDFVVQFDAVQTVDCINISIGEKGATVEGPRAFSVFFRAPGVPSLTPGVPLPEIGIYTPSKGEVNTGLRSGIPAAHQWHNYAVRFNLPARRFTVWVDRKCRGTIDLAAIGKGADGGGAWANLPWIDQYEYVTEYVNVGADTGKSVGRTWTDNFRVGAPQETDMRR